MEGASFRPQMAVSKPQGADHKLKRADYVFGSGQKLGAYEGLQ